MLKGPESLPLSFFIRILLQIPINTSRCPISSKRLLLSGWSITRPQILIEAYSSIGSTTWSTIVSFSTSQSSLRNLPLLGALTPTEWEYSILKPGIAQHLTSFSTLTLTCAMISAQSTCTKTLGLSNVKPVLSDVMSVLTVQAQGAQAAILWTIDSWLVASASACQACLRILQGRRCA